MGDSGDEARRAAILDCDEGRRLGCGSFCCRLIVRLDPEERAAPEPGQVSKSCIDKNEEGYCVHFDRSTSYCDDWDARPRVCREYDCNADSLLQIVLRDGFVSLTRLVTASGPGPTAPKLCVPYLPASASKPALEALLARFETIAPGDAGELERHYAAEQGRLKREIAELLGSPHACAACAVGAPLPVGRWAGGKCCAHPAEKLFTDQCLATLRSAGVAPGELAGPEDRAAGCPFRTETGCALPPHCRPAACASYACDELAAELEASGTREEFEALALALADAAAAHDRARALRLAVKELEDLL